ncbi:GNAT family N-acetyltransferase [Methylosinus sporium]|uniref:GNAT family N-acetyltransferase n=1 Tax=Methylosinus sporium TaxID=428 RepID=UPI003839D7AB
MSREVERAVAAKGAFPLRLEGPRLLVRSFTVDDIQPTYVAWLNDPEVVRFSNQRFRRHDEETCQIYLSGFEGSSNYFLAIVLRESGRMIGTMTAYCNEHHQTADIGVMLGAREAWGKGFGLEAFSLVLNWLLARSDIRKVTAGTLAHNIGMIRIMERAGLRLEATRRAQELLDGQPADIVYYGRFKDA